MLNNFFKFVQENIKGMSLLMIFPSFIAFLDFALCLFGMLRADYCGIYVNSVSDISFSRIPNVAYYIFIKGKDKKFRVPYRTHKLIEPGEFIKKEGLEMTVSKRKINLLKLLIQQTLTIFICFTFLLIILILLVHLVS